MNFTPNTCTSPVERLVKNEKFDLKFASSWLVHLKFERALKFNSRYRSRSNSNWFSGLCHTWQKRHWLLRKRQGMRDRKLVGSRQRSLSSLFILPRRERSLLAGKNVNCQDSGNSTDTTKGQRGTEKKHVAIRFRSTSIGIILHILNYYRGKEDRSFYRGLR